MPENPPTSCQPDGNRSRRTRRRLRLTAAKSSSIPTAAMPARRRRLSGKIDQGRSLGRLCRALSRKNVVAPARRSCTIQGRYASASPIRCALSTTTAPGKVDERKLEKVLRNVQLTSRPHIRRP